MKKYPSIEQFRKIVKEVRRKKDYACAPYPTLKFTGTVKLHGTNAGIVKYADGGIYFQSRERVLSLEQDNAGFMAEMIKIDLSSLFNGIQFNDYCAVYGEWCGGNIQKNVAIAQLPKMFVIFALKVDDRFVSLPHSLQDNANSIYNILQFQTYSVDINFNKPELIQNKLIELTLAVEKECPVAKFFGVSGIGEGIVFACDSDTSLIFKSKGELHSVSKVVTLNNIDTDKFDELNAFVESVATENRFNQGAEIIGNDIKKTGAFISWVVKDVLKEEADTIQNNSLDLKSVKSSIAEKARRWYVTFNSTKV
jgi:hypothetical protein